MNNLPNLSDLKVFCVVAKRKSFVASADELGASPAYVSKRINLLENNNWAIKLINLQITLIIIFLLSIILKKFLYYGNFSNSKNLIIFGIYLLLESNSTFI